MTQIRKVPATPKQAAKRREAIDRALDPVLFRALSDPTRVALLACVAKCGRGCSVTEIAECTSVDLSVVSRHLAVLADAGALQATKEGRMVRYHVRYNDVSQSLRSLADAFDECCPAGEDGLCGC
jgi:ArsR family transcriptional regulator